MGAVVLARGGVDRKDALYGAVEGQAVRGGKVSMSCWLPLVKPLSWEPKAVLRRAVAGIRRLLYNASPAANRSDCFPFLVLFQCPTAHRFEQVVAEQGKNDGDELFHGFGIQRGSVG